jgi:hypothetical protein
MTRGAVDERVCRVMGLHAPMPYIEPELHLERVVSDLRSAITSGQRPTFYVKWQWDGTAAELEFLDLPGVWTVSPSEPCVAMTARKRIALELRVPETSFDVEVIGTSPYPPD